MLKALWRRAVDEGIGALLEVDALLTHLVCEPVMLIEADAGGERKVGTDADEHPSPLPIVDVEIVLDNPSVRDLQMPAVRLAITDRCHDACRLASLENDHHGIRARPFEVWIDEVVAAAIRGVQNWNVPLRCPPFQPLLELLGDAAQRVAADRVQLPIRVEEANNALWLLERLNQPVQQKPIKASIIPTNAVPVMLVEGVHDQPPGGIQRPRIVPAIARVWSPRGYGDIKGEALG